MKYFLKDKNDYSITVYHNHTRRLFREYVHNVLSYVNYLKANSIEWDYIVVYCRRDRQPICYYKNGDYIHQKPDEIYYGRKKPTW